MQMTIWVWGGQTKALPCGQLLEPQVLLNSGKFRSCGVCGKEEMAPLVRSPLAHPPELGWQALLWFVLGSSHLVFLCMDALTLRKSESSSLRFPVIGTLTLPCQAGESTAPQQSEFTGDSSSSRTPELPAVTAHQGLVPQLRPHWK